jgi:hypothetical protein
MAKKATKKKSVYQKAKKAVKETYKDIKRGAELMTGTGEPPSWRKKKTKKATGKKRRKGY